MTVADETTPSSLGDPVDPRPRTRLSQQTAELLMLTIMRIVACVAEPHEVSAVLRRVCDESGCAPPELMLLQIKQLWTKATAGTVHRHDELDRRYSGLISQYLALYHSAR